jgi:hypothetical protein
LQVQQLQVVPDWLTARTQRRKRKFEKVNRKDAKTQEEI